MLKRGAATKADLSLVDLDGRLVVVKDFADKAAWVRLIGRWQISRECAAFEHLGPMAGLVGFLGRVDAHALALEWIDGRDLIRVEDRGRHGLRYLEELRAVVAAMHARGLAHCDLRSRDNVMLDAEGRVRVIDLAAAIRLRPGGLAARCLFPWVKLADDAAILKWKRLLGAGEYTAQERAFLKRYRFWRSLWVFNRKAAR